MHGGDGLSSRRGGVGCQPRAWELMKPNIIDAANILDLLPLFVKVRSRWTGEQHELEQQQQKPGKKKRKKEAA